MSNMVYVACDLFHVCNVFDVAEVPLQAVWKDDVLGHVTFDLFLGNFEGL